MHSVLIFLNFIGLFYDKFGGKYEGGWRNDQMHGFGIFSWSDGSMYSGDWLHGKQTGNGKYHKLNGRVYSGQWLNGRFHGQGKLIKPNSDIYLGAFKNGRFEGRGLYREASGTISDGTWRKGKKHGDFVHVEKGFPPEAQKWQNGVKTFPTKEVDEARRVEREAQRRHMSNAEARKNRVVDEGVEMLKKMDPIEDSYSAAFSNLQESLSELIQNEGDHDDPDGGEGREIEETSVCSHEDAEMINVTS